MSATPEWMVTCTSQRPMGSNGPVRMEIDCRDQHAMEKAVRALDAFDALLAVAKACALEHDDGWRADELDALAALDAAHPDWRTW